MAKQLYPFTIHWFLGKQVIYAHLERQLQGDEGQMFNEMMTKQIRKGDAPVFLIMDLRDVKMELAPKIATLQKAGGYRTEPNLRWLLTIIDSDRILNFVASTVTQIAGTSYANFDSLDEALAFIRMRLTHKDWSQARLDVLAK